MIIFLNAASLLLGLAAWALPISTILTRRYRAAYPSVSFALCCFSLLCQLLEIQIRVGRSDWSGIEDTMYAVVFAGFVLVLVNLAANIAAYTIARLRR